MQALIRRHVVDSGHGSHRSTDGGRSFLQREKEGKINGGEKKNTLFNLRFI